MRFAALDVSRRRIGVAISDEEGTFSAYEYTLHLAKKSLFVSKKEAYKRIKKQLEALFLKHKPAFTFVGLPTSLSGNRVENTDYVKHFMHTMRYVIGKHSFLDERYSTNFAMQLAGPTDQVVARLLLIIGMEKYKLLNITN